MISAAAASSATGVQLMGASSAPKADAAPSAADQKRAAAEKAKSQNLQSALTTLKSLGDSGKSTAAGLAAQKLEALKQRLKMLMMFGGDPRQMAKEAAQIAKEIGQAAKDYAQAAGGSSAGGSSGQAATPATAPGALPDADAPPADDPAVMADPGAADPTHATAPTPATTAKPASDAAKTDPEAPKDKGPAPTVAGRPSGPDAILEEAKQLAARARAILKAAIAKAKAHHADPAELQADENKMSEADKAIRDAEQAMGSDTASSGYAADGQALFAPAADPAPAVSVQA